MKREKELVKNTFILSIGTFLSGFATVFTLPLYTAYLTKTEYGIYDIVTILVSVFIPIVTLQIQQAAFRFIVETKEQEDADKIISNVYLFIFPVLFIALVVLFLLLNNVDIFIRVLICVYLFLETLMNISRQVVRGFGDTKSYSVSAVVHAVVSILLSVAFLYFWDWGLPGALVALCISILISFIALCHRVQIYRRIHICYIDINFLKKCIKYSLPLVPNTLSMWILNMSDRLVITFMLGLEANAVYAIANKIPGIFGQVYNTFNMAWQESASREANEADTAEYYSVVINAILDILLSILALMIGFMPYIFVILFNSSYDEAFYQIPILLFAMLFSCLNAFYGGIYLGLKETKKIGISTILAAIINLLINYIFIKKIGLYAASLSTLISFCITAFYRGMDIQKKLHLRYRMKRIVVSLIVNIFLIVISYQRNGMYNIINLLISVLFVFLLNKNRIFWFCRNICVLKKRNK